MAVGRDSCHRVEDIVAPFPVAKLHVAIVVVVLHCQHHALSLVDVMGRIRDVLIEVKTHVYDENVVQLLGVHNFLSVLSEDHRSFQEE